jgi:hypothetical protein
VRTTFDIGCERLKNNVTLTKARRNVAKLWIKAKFSTVKVTIAIRKPLFLPDSHSE